MRLITVFTRPNCQACAATKRELLANGFGFTEIDVDLPEYAHHAQRLVDDGWRTMPVVEVAGHSSWSGHKPDLIRALAA